MAYSIIVNEKSKEGKSVLAMLRLIADKMDSVQLIEEVEDDSLAKAIVKGKLSGYADTKKVMKKLGLK
jgi:hypothetical protein